MPSKKPIIHFNTDQWIIDKMKHIASENSRSLAKEMEYLCKQRIKNYEAENGEIDIEENSNESTLKKVMKIAENKDLPISKKMKESFTIGFDKGAGKKSKDAE